MLSRIVKRIYPIFILLFILFPSYGMAGDMPKSPAGGESLDLRGGRQGYYYAADRDNSFDGEFFKNGMTIELWFCPARTTERGEWWNLVTKLAYLYKPIYQIIIKHEYQIDPLGVETERMLLSRGRGGWGIWDIAGGRDYEPEWRHVVLQGHGIENGFAGRGFSGIVFIDGISKGEFRSSGSSYVFDGHAPLYVGGFPAGVQTPLHIGKDYIRSDIATFDGLIDELRISDEERYEYGETIEVKEHVRVDEHTVALWHFDEGPDALTYKDSSGNGHTLFAAGQFAVDPKHKIPSLWGAIKEQRK